MSSALASLKRLSPSRMTRRRCRHQPSRDQRDRRHRESDGDQRQSGDAAPVCLEVPRRRVERRVEQHRRHEEGQRELGIESHARHVRQQRQRRAGEREQRRIRRVEPAGARREDGAHEEQRDDELEDRYGEPQGSGADRIARPPRMPPYCLLLGSRSGAP